MQLLLPSAPAAHTPHVPLQQPAGLSRASRPADQPAQASFSQQQSPAQHGGSENGYDDTAQQMQEGVSQQQAAGGAGAGSRPSRVYQVENDGQV